ncbi:MAG: hypothetical protein HRT73_09050, partial [Flavobacteriales bacterium]|nr:hypothetical protein [Flavobacteriales bacterium]
GSRESPSGFTHIELFGDSTFKLLFTGFINDNTYKGEYFIEDGLIYFSYIDTISDYVGNNVHIKNNELYSEKGQLVASLSVNLLDSVYGRDSYFKVDGLREQTIYALWGLESNSELPGSAVGIAGVPSEHLEKTKSFQQSINKEEALILYNHPNTFIKTVAFKKLWYSKEQTVFTKIVNSFQDSTIIYQASGCVGMDYKISEYFLNVIEYPNDFFWDTETLSSEEKMTIDSLAIFNNMKNLKPPSRESVELIVSQFFEDYFNSNPNNVELSEINNEKLFTLAEEHSSVVVSAFCSSENKIQIFLISQFESPIHDLVELQFVYAKIKGVESSCSKKKEVLDALVLAGMKVGLEIK